MASVIHTLSDTGLRHGCCIILKANRQTDRHLDPCHHVGMHHISVRLYTNSSFPMGRHHAYNRQLFPRDAIDASTHLRSHRQ